jgi:hypothetical protein
MERAGASRSLSNDGVAAAYGGQIFVRAHDLRCHSLSHRYDVNRPLHEI